MGKLQMGHGLDARTELGPLVNASSRDKVAELEPVSRDADTFATPKRTAAFAPTAFVPVETLAAVRRT